MADTCVLGHAWTQGRVLCPVCGFGPRAVPGADAGQVASARQSPLERLAAAPVTQAVPVMASVAAGGAGQAVEQVLSPDGQWAWDGAQWLPHHVDAAPIAQQPAVGEPTKHAARRRVDSRLLLVLLLIVAAALAADFFLKLPPLGHKATATPAPVVVHHVKTSTAAGRPGHATAAIDGDLARVAGAEAKAYRATHAFVATPSVLRADGATTTSGDRVLVAAKGLSYCAVVGKVGGWYVLNSHFSGSLGTVVFTTPAAAEATCPAGLGTFSSL